MLQECCCRLPLGSTAAPRQLGPYILATVLRGLYAWRCLLITLKQLLQRYGALIFSAVQLYESHS
jgi:hypothetical protein